MTHGFRVGNLVHVEEEVDGVKYDPSGIGVVIGTDPGALQIHSAHSGLDGRHVFEVGTVWVRTHLEAILRCE